MRLTARREERCRVLRDVVTKVFQGDASDYRLHHEAGIDKAPSVHLTTNDDAVNVYLWSYCRRLNPEPRIVSRITHERTLDAIYRAGAALGQRLAMQRGGKFARLTPDLQLKEGDELIMVGANEQVSTFVDVYH